MRRYKTGLLRALSLIYRKEPRKNQEKMKRTKNKNWDAKKTRPSQESWRQSRRRKRVYGRKDLWNGYVISGQWT